MKLKTAKLDLYVPDGTETTEALARTTHLAVVAHQDDIEILAYNGVVECFGAPDKWFTGVVVTDGGGSARSGIYADYTDEDMKQVRLIEQRKAAYIGEYSCQLQLGYPSSVVKNPSIADVSDDIYEILVATKPKVVYLHNLADKHDTHIGVALRTLKALRRLAPEDRPTEVYGCEVWRNLDWMLDDEKTVLSVSGRPNLAAALIAVFDSQITGGKRYDLATAGRWLANATYYASHATDKESALTFAMDLKPLVDQPELDITEYVTGYIERFLRDVKSRIAKFS